MRTLLTDLIKVYPGTEVIGEYGEKNWAPSGTVGYSGYGSFQTYFSGEYDVDRDTINIQGRVITDDLGLIPSHHDYVTVNDGPPMKISGEPQKWTLRGLHHIEYNVVRLEG